jgi:hypothetical protein
MVGKTLAHKLAQEAIDKIAIELVKEAIKISPKDTGYLISYYRRK